MQATGFWQHRPRKCIVYKSRRRTVYASAAFAERPTASFGSDRWFGGVGRIPKTIGWRPRPLYVEWRTLRSAVLRRLSWLHKPYSDSTGHPRLPARAESDRRRSPKNRIPRGEFGKLWLVPECWLFQPGCSEKSHADCLARPSARRSRHSE